MIEDIEDNSYDNFAPNFRISKKNQPHLQIISTRTNKPFIQATEETNSSSRQVK